MKKLIGLILSLVMMAALMVPAAAYAGKPDGVGSQDGNIEIVKKVGAKALPAPDGWPPSSGPKPHAATGLLGEVVTGNKYAILVGISDYPGDSTVLDDPAGLDLFYAARDAGTMAKILAFDPSYTIIGPFTGEADGGALASKTNILEAIQDVKGEVELGPNDEVVFYFSGHGAKRNGGNLSQGGGKVGMVVLSENGSALDFIWDNELKAAFSGFATERIVFVFDMCLAGGMIDVASQGNVVCMATTQNGTAYEYGDAYYRIDPNDPTTAPIPGMPDPEIISGAPIANGLFTYLFALVGMGGGVADIMPPDGYVTVEEAYDFARYSLEEFSANSGGLFYQIPTIRDRFKGDLLP